MFQLLTQPNDNAKTYKNLAHGHATFALHLAPANLSGFEVCPSRSPGCTDGCLNISGIARNMKSRRDYIQRARIMKTKWYFVDRPGFMEQLHCDISQAVKWANKRELKLSIRPNATSDIPWHRVPFMADSVNYESIMHAFPDVQFYDYTKIIKRMLLEELPTNYHLTFSLAENNHNDAIAVLRAGKQVAIVFRTKDTIRQLTVSQPDGAIPLGWLSVPGIAAVSAPIVNGDEHDLRFLDPAHCIVALSAKGRAVNDATGWVQDA